MQVALDHRELVITGSRIAANFYVAAEKYCSFLELLARKTKVGQLQQSFGIIRVRFERLLEKTFGGAVISLALLDVTHIEKAGTVARVELQAFLKVLLGFIKATEMAIGKPHECVGARGRVERDEVLELVNGSFRLAGHEV